MSDQHPTQHHDHATAERLHHLRDELNEIPENEFDVVAVPNSIDRSRHPARLTQILMIIGLPLVFLVSFPLCYVSALHAPTPSGYPLTIAGDSTVTGSIASEIEATASGAFDISRTTDAADAVARVEDRSTAAAIVVGDTEVTTVVAGAGGRIAASAAESVGAKVAAQLGVPAVINDVVPLQGGDVSGIGVFYLVLTSSIGGYLALGAVRQIRRDAGLVATLTTAAIAAVVVPVITFAMVSAFTGDFGATFGTIAGALGVAMLSTFTVCLMRMLLMRLLGQAAIFAAIVLVMAINLPSMGGSLPAPMLPPFWQAIHSVWFGAGAQEAIRSIVYFHGHQFGRWFTQLVLWTGGLLVLVLGIDAARHVRRRRRVAQSVVGGLPEASEPQRSVVASVQ